RAPFSDVLAMLAAEGGAEGADAAAELAALAESSGDEGAMSHWAEKLEALLHADAPELPRAVLAYRLALLRLRQGADAAALAWLRAAVEADDAEGDVARGAWQQLVELAVKADDAGAAAEALVGLASDERTGDEDAKRASHLLSAARIYRQRLAAPGEAMP